MNESLKNTNAGLQKTIQSLRAKNNRLKQELEIWRKVAMSTQRSLVEYLSQLNSSDSTQGIWVNPDNYTEYRIGQFQFENGGILDDWKYIGSLEEISFGSQSYPDAIENVLKSGYNPNKKNSDIRSYTYNDQEMWVSIKGVLAAYSKNRLDRNFQKSLEEEADTVVQEWAQLQAEYFVSNELPKILEVIQ